MPLIYRGQTAQLSEISTTIDTGMTGTFLGRSFSIRQPQQLTRPVVKEHLRYRGNLYH